MSTLPQITVVGTLTSDPELRFTQSGTAVASFNIACNTRKKEGNEWVDGDTTFVRGSIWKEYAENVTESLQKGDRVFVTGDLKQREYEKDGNKRTVYEITANEMGPTLRFATARVSKIAKNGGGRRQQQSNNWVPDDEPGWG